MIHIKHADGIPKYIQLANLLREKLAAREYSPGQQIPTETELCERYKVSRVTVREAIDRLVQENLLYREQGRGTYVTPQKLKRNVTKIYSFSYDMVRLGLKPSSTLFESALVEAEPALANKLKLPASNKKCAKIVRVRLADGIPVLIEDTYIPDYLCPGLLSNNLENSSLYQIITETYHLSFEHAEETYEAVILSGEEAKVLECERAEAQPGMSIDRITYLEHMVPVEYTHSIGRGDRLSLTVDMVADRTDFQRKIDF